MKTSNQSYPNPTLQIGFKNDEIKSKDINDQYDQFDETNLKNDEFSFAFTPHRSDMPSPEANHSFTFTQERPTTEMWVELFGENLWQRQLKSMLNNRFSHWLISRFGFWQHFFIELSILIYFIIISSLSTVGWSVMLLHFVVVTFLLLNLFNLYYVIHLYALTDIYRPSTSFFSKCFKKVFKVRAPLFRLGVFGIRSQHNDTIFEDELSKFLQYGFPNANTGSVFYYSTEYMEKHCIISKTQLATALNLLNAEKQFKESGVRRDSIKQHLQNDWLSLILDVQTKSNHQNLNWTFATNLLSKWFQKDTCAIDTMLNSMLLNPTDNQELQQKEQRLFDYIKNINHILINNPNLDLNELIQSTSSNEINNFDDLLVSLEFINSQLEQHIMHNFSK